MFENFIKEKDVIDRYSINPILFYYLKDKFELQENCEGYIDTFDYNFSKLIAEIKKREGFKIIDFKEEITYFVCEATKYNSSDYFNLLSLDSFAVIKYYNNNLGVSPYITTKAHIHKQHKLTDQILNNILHTFLAFKYTINNDHDENTYNITEEDIEMVFSILGSEGLTIFQRTTKDQIIVLFEDIKEDINRVYDEYLKHLEMIN